MTTAPIDPIPATRTVPSIERGTIVRGRGDRRPAPARTDRRARDRWAPTGSRRSTSVAIYSVVALGFGILYGRVGLISLGQVALLTIGCWIGTRLSLRDVAARSRCSCSLPVALTCRDRRSSSGCRALRLSGLYLALITLMFAGATTIVLAVTDFPNGGGGFTGRSATGALTTSTPPVRRPSWAIADVAFYRYTVDRLRDPVPARAPPCRRQAGTRLGRDSRERAGGACRRRQHHALQALGVRARVIRHRRRGLPARGAGRRAAGDHLPDAGLAHPRPRPR